MAGFQWKNGVQMLALKQIKVKESLSRKHYNDCLLSKSDWLQMISLVYISSYLT